MKILLAITLFLTANTALAWDGWTNGVIDAIEVTNAENYGFRISLKGITAMCGTSSPGWAYINKSNDNYQVYVSTILAMALAAKKMTVYTNKNPANGQCEIGHISMLVN